MAQLLQLGGQGARAESLAATQHPRAGEIGQRRHEAIPLDRRIPVRVPLVQQLAILQEEQCFAHRSGNLVERAVHRRGEVAGRDQRAVPASQGKPRLRLLVIWREKTQLGNAAEAVRDSRLPDDMKAALLQSIDDIGKYGVTKSHVERTGTDGCGSVSAPAVDREDDASHVARDHDCAGPRNQARGERSEDQQQRENDEPCYSPEPAATRGPFGCLVTWGFDFRCTPYIGTRLKFTRAGGSALIPHGTTVPAAGAWP